MVVMPGGLRTLIYHRVPVQICYALGRADIKSLDKVRRQTREQLLANNPEGSSYIENALAALDASEAAEAIVRDVYGCPAGRACRVATEEQRNAFEADISRRMSALRLRAARPA
jgi:hypothetical protein